MMQSLIGMIPATDSDLLQEKTLLRFKDASKFITPEALIVYEQQLIPEERLFGACQMEYNKVLYEPDIRYVPQEILDDFQKYNVIVCSQDVEKGTITLGTIPEFADEVILSDKYVIHKILIPIYIYVDIRTRQYGSPDFLAELPTKDKWDFIVNEALQMEASDITITNHRGGAQVYYNVRKTKKYSRRVIDKTDVKAIATMLASSANATMADDSSKPRYFAIDINKHNRGRVVINHTYYGYLVTIRVLPNTVLNKSIEDLNISPSTCQFIRETMLSPEKGLRLFIGETMSGKNTTILASLLELVHKNTFKIVSLEQPVEILVDGIEQINAETDTEFEQNADSLLRQNPDIVYFTEITARTAKSIMQQSNTSKAVFSSIHANSISEVLFRLQDITQLPLDRIILTLHSCVYQELVRDDKNDRVTPYNRCVYFSEELKMQLYGKPVAEVIGILSAEEKRWK